MSRITVVVPVYNVEDYLDWCLGSLEAQTLRDIDIICVNDGSTDGSRTKLAEWESRDARIRVIDKPNGGLSSARNAGILAAQTDYVCFLDSDDRFHQNACEEMVRLLDKTEADILTFGATCYPEDAAYPWLTDVLNPRDAVFDGFTPDILFKEKSRPFAWRTACRTEFLVENQLMFEEGLRFGEDQVFHFAIYPRARRTALSSAKLYEYRVVREGSLMSRLRDDFGAKMLEHVKILDCILKDWSEAGYLSRYAAEMVAFCMDFALYDAIKLDDTAYLAVMDRLRELLSHYWSAGEVAEMPLAPATKKMALEACHQVMGAAARKRLVLEYYAQQHGKKALLRRLLTGKE